MKEEIFIKIKPEKINKLKYENFFYASSILFYNSFESFHEKLSS